MEFLKLLSTNEIVAQVLSFLVLFFLLRAFFWKRFLRILDTRKERIAAELKKIEEEKAKTQETWQEYQEKLKSIDKVASIKIEEAFQEGEKLKEEIKKDAQGQAQRIIDKAKVEIENELFRAREQLKNEIVDLALTATERLLEEKVTPEKDERLVKEILRDLRREK